MKIPKNSKLSKIYNTKNYYNKKTFWSSFTVYRMKKILQNVKYKGFNSKWKSF